MEYKRLTIKNSDGTHSQPTDLTFEKVFYRLAELEDKLERGELVENKVITYVNMARSDGKTLVDKALKYDELKAKIEQGKMIELPCRVRDKVYSIYKTCSKCQHFKETSYDYDCWCELDSEGSKAMFNFDGDTDCFYEIHETEFIYSMIDRLGKSIFLTKAEAEKKLKELKGV